MPYPADKTSNRAIIIGGISGAGKSTITFELARTLNFVERAISVTTRKKREDEIDKKNYYFISMKKFFELLDKEEILEYTEVLGNFYGTLKSELERIWNKGKYPLLNIDYNGVNNLEKLGIKLLKIYLLPPTYNELLKRILQRGIDKNEFSRRIYFIKKELKTIFNIEMQEDKNFEIEFDKLWTEKYDYIIINSTFKKVVEEVKEYIRRYQWT
ncbi:MAG: hypothetical protein ACK4NF_00040 [Planctomycetota bacterium]